MSGKGNGSDSGRGVGVGAGATRGAPSFYVASRASLPDRPAMWRSHRREGVNIVSSWIDEVGPGETGDMAELWVRIGREIASADALVLFAQPEDLPLKGALIEVGMALALGKPVRVVAPKIETLGSWERHPLVSRWRLVLNAFWAPLPDGRRSVQDQTPDDATRTPASEGTAK